MAATLNALDPVASLLKNVKDIIPLGVPRHSSANVKSTNHLVPRLMSQDIDKKHVKTQEIFKSEHMQPLKSTVLDQTSTSTLASSSGTKKGSGRGQNNAPNCNVLMRKVQFNNNDNCSSKDGSFQSGTKKGTLLPRTREREKEFALALCKQLNENLKVEKSMVNSGITKSLVPPPHVSRSPSDSTSSALHRDNSVPSNRVEKQAQRSAEKLDKLLTVDQNSIFLSPVLSNQDESTPCQATTPSGRLSLKRPREGSSDGKKEGKRFCQDSCPLSSSSANGSFSAGVQNTSSPPKYVRTAILKTSNEKGSLILEDIKKTNTAQSSNLARQLFKEKAREPNSESFKSQSVTQTTNISEIDQLTEVAKKSNESNFQVGNLCNEDSSTSLSCKLNQKCSNGGSSPASSHTSWLPNLMDEVKISSPPLHSEFKAPSSLGLMGSEKDEKKSSKNDPNTSLNSSLPSTPAVLQGEKRKGKVLTDPLDLELADDLSFESCSLNLSSSESSEEEKLLSLQEILERSARVPTTPVKGVFSEPSTPIPKTAPENGKGKVTSYTNTMEQMLKEKVQNQKSKELEKQLLQACKEDLLKLEDEENENTVAALSHEQREFLQKFSVTSCAIRDIHPGEEVFKLDNFGRLFNHLSLDLSKTGVIPNNKAQQTLLRAHTEHALLLLSAGLFKRAYSSSPCQPQVTRWLFQMMSVHPDPCTCAQILQTMTAISLSAAQHIVENSNKKFEVWVPSVQDIALVFLNMGVSFVNLFPLEALQPPFTEGDLLESFPILPDGMRTQKECSSFPEHNFESVIKYMVLCTALCPKVYTHEELLLLLVLVCKVSLETSLQLLPTRDLSCLLQHVLNNMTHWESQLPEICQSITDLTEDHHNLRRLVQLLPYCSRGKQLRRHLSVSVISKLLNHRCTYKPSCPEFRLSDLRGYLPRMRPSSLLKGFITAQKEQQEADDCGPTPDQQAYYLCYSLLALTNEASNFEFLPSGQRNELLLLSAELEKHIKCDIRESEKMLYRSKVKDFVARIYTRWQVLLQRSRPQEGKLYDYWTPLPEDEMPINEENHSTKQQKQEASEELQSDDSDSAHSDEEWMEEEDDVAVKSEEEREETVGESEGKKGEVQDILSDVKVEEPLVDNEDGKDGGSVPVDDDLLGGGSHEEFMESDLDEELLEDEESLEQVLMGREKDEQEKDDFLEEVLLD